MAADKIFVELQSYGELEAVEPKQEVIDAENAVFYKDTSGKWHDMMDRAWESVPKLPAYLILDN